MNNPIKKENEVFKKDLSKVTGTYTNELNTHMQEINSKFEDKSIDTNAYRNYILEVIKPAHDTPAKRKFILNLSRKHNKCEILFYVSNAWLNGKGLGTI